MSKKKAALEISFGWLFALIAGAIILFLAIYLSVKLIGSEKEIISAETGKEIGILLNPLETSFESAQTTSISIPAETRIHNSCDESGEFGRQIIQLDQKNFGKWTKTDVNVFFNSKYIFSQAEIEGKKFYIFSKPFSFPFKIADLIYMTSANDVYCFLDAPNDVEEELTNLNQSNLLVKECGREGEITVCFGGEICDISVDYDSGIVEKDGEELYFAGVEDKRALMYAAIFSDKDTYECQIKRLIMRVGELSLLYADKETITAQKGCGENLLGDLEEFSGMAYDLESSEDLGLMGMKAEIIEAKNNGRTCLLW
jgi:hypothetical protein